MSPFKYMKAVQVLNFFAIKEGGTINKMKALKLVWLSDRAHLRQYARPITNDMYYAMDWGPVASNTRDLLNDTSFLSKMERDYLKDYIVEVDSYRYKSIGSSDLKVFSETDIEILQAIYTQFGLYDKFKLSELSHEFPEWQKFENGLVSGISSRYEMDYSDFYEDSEKSLALFDQDKVLLELSKELFEDALIADKWISQ